MDMGAKKIRLSDEADSEAAIFIIISSLPFKDAVRASVLSTKFHNAWHSAVNVDLDEKFFVREGASASEITVQRRNFVDFVEKWMGAFNMPNLNTFRLAFSGLTPESYLPDMQRCVNFVVKDGREIVALDLDFSNPSWDEQNLRQNPESFVGIPAVDVHAMLESLTLSAVKICVLNLPSNFSALKKIQLAWIDLPDPSLDTLVRRCPVLEVLALKRCRNMTHLTIKSRRLKIVILDKCTNPVEIVVETPSLKIFKYCGGSPRLQTDWMRSVEEAEFDYSFQTNLDDDGDMLHAVLADFFSVRLLTICSYMLQVLPMAEEPISLSTKMVGVKHLILKTQLHVKEFYGITLILNSCPHLEVLELHLGPRRIFEEYTPPFQIRGHPFVMEGDVYIKYACLTNTLKTVVVKGFKGDAGECIVIRFLLKYSRVLESLKIYLSGAKGAEMESVYRAQAHRMLRCDFGAYNVRATIETCQD